MLLDNKVRIWGKFELGRSTVSTTLYVSAKVKARDMQDHGSMLYSLVFSNSSGFTEQLSK